ncbi:MAG: DUF4168 domain-containing protein [Bacteroidales bacterium]
MNLKQIGIIVMVLSVMWGCNQNSTKKQENNANEESTPQEQGMFQGQGQPSPEELQKMAEDVSDDELQQFVSVVGQVQMINQETQQQMIGAVQDGGLDVERFNEIMQSQQDPSQESDASNEELQNYENAIQELENIQLEATQQMQDKIVEEGLTVNRYQELGAIIQVSPELQEKFQSFLEGAQ